MSLAAEVWSGTHSPRTLPRLLFGFQWWPWGNRPISRISPYFTPLGSTISTGPQVGRHMRSNFLPCCADIFNRSYWRSLVGSKLQRHDVVNTCEHWSWVNIEDPDLAAMAQCCTRHSPILQLFLTKDQRQYLRKIVRTWKRSSKVLGKNGTQSLRCLLIHSMFFLGWVGGDSSLQAKCEHCNAAEANLVGSTQLRFRGSCLIS